MIITKDKYGCPLVVWDEKKWILYLLHGHYATYITFSRFPFEYLEYLSKVKMSPKMEQAFRGRYLYDTRGHIIASFIPELELLLIKRDGLYTILHLPDAIANVNTIRVA